MEGDDSTAKILRSLNHRETALRVVAERAFMKTLMGGCSAPVAVQSKIESESLSLEGGVFRTELDFFLFLNYFLLPEKFVQRTGAKRVSTLVVIRNRNSLLITLLKNIKLEGIRSQKSV